MISSIAYGFNSTTRKYEATLAIPARLGNHRLVVRSGATKIRDAAGNRLDGAADGDGDGEDFERIFSIAYPAPTPAGPEFRVNTSTTVDPWKYGPKSTAMDADGDFVVTWSSNLQDGSGWGVYAQRYNAAGVAQGAEFRVNTFTTGDQSASAVAMDADGDFVVVWAGRGLYGDGIYARRYNAGGVAQGSEFSVVSNSFGQDWSPMVAMDADGDFVVAWLNGTRQNSTPQLANNAIYAKRYNAAGVAQGGGFQVNHAFFYETGDFYQTSVVSIHSRTCTDLAVAMDADGDFVVTWISEGESFLDIEVRARRYNASGVGQGGGEFRVNTYTIGTKYSSAVAMDADGDFVVAWTGNGQDGSGHGIYAQRYNAAGVAQGAEFRVDSFSSSGQKPSVALGSDGDFVVSWRGFGQEGYGVYARWFTVGGLALGPEFRVNTHTTGSYDGNSVAMDADGDFVVSWTSSGQDGSSFGVYAQRYFNIDGDDAGPIVSEVAAADGGLGDVAMADGALRDAIAPGESVVFRSTSLVVTFGEVVVGADVAANYRLFRDGVDVSSLIIGASFGNYNGVTNKYEAVLTLARPLSSAHYKLVAL
ncbi:MAG: hypothetical protein ACRDD1_06765, partial [Planctomycetia bacterium]